MTEPKPKPTLPSEVAAWAAASAAISPALCRAILKIKTQGLSGSKRGVGGSGAPRAPNRFHAGMEGSATPNEPSRFQAGVEGSATPNAPSSFKLPSVAKIAEPMVTSATTSNGIFVKPVETNPENPFKRARTYRGMDVITQMPAVSTLPERVPMVGELKDFYKHTREVRCV